MRPLRVPELAVPEALAECERRLVAACPDRTDFVRSTLGRLPPDRWVLEWHLPWWLGHRFGLPVAVAERLVLANVLGLVSIRLEDDLCDGEVAAPELEAADTLRTAAYGSALGALREVVPALSPLWGEIDRRMAAWRDASRSDGAGEGRLAARGAPLYIGARAVTLLADAEDRWPTVERCLDHALSALVLHDDVADWESDVPAGRWNAFVERVLPGMQGHADSRRVRIAVHAAVLAGGPTTRAYAQVADEARLAADEAIALDCLPLATHLESYARQVLAQAAALEDRYTEVRQRSLGLLSGAVLPSGANPSWNTQ